MPVIELQIEVDVNRELVFDLSRSIDLHKISTVQTNEEAISGVTSGLIGLGESVTWRAKHFGVYQTLTSKVTKFDYPNFFVDEMVDGAFDRFRHEHRFSQLSKGRTLMVDVFDYTSPLGLLGHLADKIFLQGYMKSLLLKRNLIVKDFAETGKWREVLDRS